MKQKLTRRRRRYRQIIRDCDALPERDPRPIPEPVKSRSFVQKTKEFFSKPVRDAVTDTYDLVVRSALGKTVIADKVPVSKLSNSLACHLAGILGEAVLMGKPIRIMYADLFTAHIDMGHGKVLELGVELHRVPIIKDETLASIVVQESDLTDPWASVFAPSDLIPESQRIVTHSVTNKSGETPTHQKRN
jgi:hypothetical protein